MAGTLPITFDCMSQGRGEEPLDEILAEISVAPGELILVGDVGGHQICLDEAGGVDVRTADGASVPECVGEGRVLFYDHHYRSRAPALAAGFENAADLVWSQAERIVAHVRKLQESGAVDRVRVVTQSPPDLDSVVCFLLFQELVREAGGGPARRPVLGHLASFHARRSDLGRYGPPEARADHTLEGVLEGYIRLLPEPRDEVEAGVSFLARLVDQAEGDEIPLEAMAGLVERVLASDEESREGFARVRRFLDDLAASHGQAGAAAVHPECDWVHSLSRRTVRLPLESGETVELGLTAVDLSTPNPISKLVMHTCFSRGDGMVILRSENAEGFNCFGALAPELGATMKGVLTPFTERTGIASTDTYRHQVFFGRLEADEDLHGLVDLMGVGAEA